MLHRLDAPAGQFERLEVTQVVGCGIKVDGSVACWGDNSSWLNNQASELELDKVSLKFHDICGLRPDRSLVCIGDLAGLTPTGRFIDVASGRSFACGLRENGAITCWFGNMQWTGAVPSGGPFVSLTAGYSHVCALRADGTASCWGSTAAPVPAGARFVQIDASEDQTCGLTTDHELRCWGRSHGALPTGTFVDVAAAPAYSCALRSDREAVCWGATTAPDGAVRGVEAAGRTSGGFSALRIVLEGSKETPGGKRSQLAERSDVAEAHVSLWCIVPPVSLLLQVKP